MSTLRKKLITVLAVLFCALLCISTALIIPENDNTANAFPSTSSTKNVADLASVADDGTIVFNSENLKKLYKNLSGSGTTFKDVEKLFSTNSGSKYHASDLVANAGGSEYIVNFGGEQWIPTFLSKSNGNDGTTNTGNIILTLWLADIDGMVQYSTWSNNFSGQNPPYNTTSPRLPGVYGTSYVRAYLTGAPYADSAMDYTLTNINDGHVSKWKKFKETWDGYLVTPNKMSWQLMQDSTQILYDTTQQAYITGYIPNESLGKLTGAHWYKDSGWPNDIDMAHLQDKTDYNSWGDDKVWLPSVTETGISTYTALWKLSATQRNSSGKNWLRSCASGNTFQCRRLDPDASVTLINSFDEVTTPLAVRPAIHLNLSEAENGRGIDFGTDNTASGTDNGVKIEELSKTYTGDEFTLNIPDYDKLDFGTITDGNVTASEVDTIKGNGEFKAKEPAENNDKSYIITVKPKSNQYWDDAANAINPDDRTATRQYRITIKLAEISVTWGNLAVKSGESLLQDSVPSVKGGSAIEQTIVQKLYKIDPDATDKTLPQNPDWTERGENTESLFTASKSGTYTVYYIIEAKFHKPTAVDSYDVTVGSDSIKFTVNGDLSIGSGKFSENKLDKAATDSFIKNQVRNKVTLTRTGNNTVIDDPDELDEIWSKLEIYPFTYNSNNAKVNSTPNTNGYYKVGTYLLGVRYKDGTPAAQMTYTFEWDKDGDREIHPTFTIDKKEVDVKVVAKTEGGSLTHVYGESHVDMAYELVNANALSDGEKIDDLKLWDNFTIKDTDGKELEKNTPAGTYYIVGAALDSNYKVNFVDSEYVITKRSVKLQVTDETVGYGTSFDGYKFKVMTAVDDNVITGDNLETLTADVPRKLKQGEIEFNFSSSLVIGEYDLYAGVEKDGKYIFETDNYIFEILKGKLTVTKGNFDLSGVVLDNKGYIYDGEPKSAEISGVPEGVTVSYRYVNYETGEELDGAPTEVGLYLVYASFSHSSLNHNLITTVKAAYIRIAYTDEELNQAYPPLPTDADLAAAADLAKKKTEAKKTLDEEAQKKKGEIDADVNLSAEEKKAAKEEIDKELKEGNAAIDKAKDKDGVDKAFNDGKKEIDDTAELATSKGAAKSELDKAAQAKKEAIDNNPDLTDEEKQAAKDKVDEELAKGKAEIDGATDVNGVQATESTTKTNIENIKAEHKGSFPWWILAVIAGAIVLVTVIIIVVVKKRNSDDDDGGYDDYYDDEYDYDEEEESDDGDEAYGY